MRILLSTLNAKYIHSSLALRYLHSSLLATGWDSLIEEFSINETKLEIISQIYSHQPKVLAFSVYIWNIEQCLDIIIDYKLIAPEVIIVLGGPEVSYNSVEILSKYPAVDYIISGEGEVALCDLIEKLAENHTSPPIRSLSLESRVIKKDLSSLANLPSPYPYYTEKDFNNKLLYFESSRGCPFNCSYCISAQIEGVRYFPLDWVKDQLDYLVQRGASIIKFIDRSFNSDEKRAIEIMTHLLPYSGRCRFHLEILAETMSENFIEFMQSMPKGLFELEIGIQSTNSTCLKAVNRPCNWNKLSSKLKALSLNKNFHIHLDLIAGLPYEDYLSFKQSFNLSYELQADVLQLGFLKMLPGSKIRKQAALYDYKYQNKAPYQVLANKFITYPQILMLMRIEDLLEKHSNSNLMEVSLPYLIEEIYLKDAFNFYEEYVKYWERKNYFRYNHKKEALINILMSFIKETSPRVQTQLNELLKYDYLAKQKNFNLPAALEVIQREEAAELKKDLLKKHWWLEKHFSAYANMNARDLGKKIHVEFLIFHPWEKVFSKEPKPWVFIYSQINQVALAIIDLNNA